MADQIWYQDGKVSVETGSSVVVGLGTFWMTTVRAGDMFALTKGGPAKEFYEILSVNEDRQITLSIPWQGENETNVEYAIIRNFTGRWSISADIAYQVENLVRQFKTALQNNLKGDDGPPGKDGNTILGGLGAPAPTDGKEGDWYLDSQTWDIYRKEAGGWIRRGSLVGPKGEPGKDGVRWYYDETPSASVGNVGDINFNGTTGDIHRRTATGWDLIGNFRGPQGKQGPKGDTGPKGDPARWLSGPGVPSGGTGSNGDMYLNVDTGEIYRKASDVWVLQGSIKGRVGDRGPAGPVGLVWRGAWDSSMEYVPNDAVQHAGNVWIAKTGNTNVSPPATASTPSNSAWDLFVPKGADGLGSGDMLRSVYDPDNSGKVLAAKLADRATAADNATTAGRAATAPWDGIEDVPSASLLAPGVVQLANSEATEEGASETLAVTPAGLKSLLEDEQKGIPILVQGENVTIETNGRQHTINVDIPPLPPAIEVVDALDSDRADAALSAKQGKVLQDLIDTGAGGITMIELENEDQIGDPALKIDSTASVIAVPGLGIFKYDAASTEIVDSETCLATQSGVGRYLILVPDVSWLFMVAVRDARKIAEFMVYPKLTVHRKAAEITWAAISANGGVQEQSISVPGVSPQDSVSVTPPNGFVSGIVFNGYITAFGIITIRCVNVTAANITPATGIWTVKIVKEVE